MLFRSVPQVNERHRQGATGARDDRSMTGKTVAVLGSRGGAGASSFAAALARAAHGQEVKARKSRGRRRRNVVLADLATGAGLDVLLGLEHEPGPRWSELALDAGVDLGTLPEWAGVRVVSRDRRPDDLPAAVRSEVLAQLARSAELVVLDVGAHAEALTVLSAASIVLIVSPRDVRSAAGVLRWRDRLASVHEDVRLVVRGPSPGGLGVLELAHVADLPVAAAGKADRRLDSALEHGLGPPPRGPLARVAARVLDEL